MEIEKLLKEQIKEINPSEKELEQLKKETSEIVEDIRKNTAKKKIKAEVFVGGSLAKNTIIKKDKYDIDIFVRFDRKYNDSEISDILGKLLTKSKRVHGSRDYFQIKKKSIIFEIIPTVKIASPKDARNVTDLSYFHVSYVKNKTNKNKKLPDEIKLAKAFCYAQNCYGAESYVNGFSGYALELLVSYYKSFLGFIKNIKDNQKIILDPEKFYKNEKVIMLELNEAKLQSPIIFVDPTFKERNALAALSSETFEKFKERCRKFLENPDKTFFEKQDLENLLKKKHKNLIIVQARTNRQRGDIAGSKLRKFYEFLVLKLERDFDIKSKEFEYNEGKNTGKAFLVLKQKNKIIARGPLITAGEHLLRFKKAHKNCFIKKGRAYAYEKPADLKEFISRLKKKEKKVLKEMSITEIARLK